MTTESKKLQTTINSKGDLCPIETPNDIQDVIMALFNDARIAHEQRKVIRKLVGALENARKGLMSAPHSWGLQITHVPNVDAALAAAAPYIQD